ncbi:HlyD family efflux transporter periplasmic adaptor subunit [uncultured Ilyobacter sp.]|uniref:efflux RND transporter periplasmic adaptor subunit n=1 Tax=uncultured Ilyobacter sp. TaxID=544433 RepID=UPI002AA80470|nr:HlyD family efflux transporter periplasmic adaptor subunit [uncultured Ilyobacter sp.]
MKKMFGILTLILIVLITTYFSIGFVNDFEHFFSKSDVSQVKEVKVIKLSNQYLDEDLVFKGMVVPKKTIPLYVEVPVVVENILIRNGSFVEVGDPLLEFSDSIKEDLKRELEGLDLDLNNVNLELLNLNSGSLKLELENRMLEVKSLKEDIRSMERSLEVLKFESKTLKEQADAKIKLLENDGISSIEANAALTISNKKAAELTDNLSKLDIGRQKYELLVLSYERLKRELNIKENILVSKRSKLLIQKRNLTEKLKNVEKPLKSPINGLVAEIFVEEGIPFAKGRKLMSIVPDGDYMIKIEVPLFMSSWIERGQEAVVTFNDGRSNNVYRGTVERVAQGAKVPINGNFENVTEVYIDLNDTDGLKLRYYVDVNIKGNEAQRALAVDYFSILEEDGLNYVYVLENGIAKKKLVTLGKKGYSKVEILGLPGSTSIIVNPFKVKDGEPVKSIIEDQIK